MSSSPSRSVKRALSAGLALAMSLSLAACGGDDSKGKDATGPQSTADGKKLVGMWPLTGLPANQAAPKHPVLVVKIDNTSSSQPQQGLGKADLVTEELVEGGITRLAVAYYSKLPGVVGPKKMLLSCRVSKDPTATAGHVTTQHQGRALRDYDDGNRKKQRHLQKP